MRGEGGAAFVQFPHPGPEHTSSLDVMSWNAGDHRRKFLIAPGRWVDADGDLLDGELVFWGEWEPPSEVVRRWPTEGRLPRLLHRPYWVRPRTDDFRQNTDPWVWGQRMMYSNCKQVTNGMRSETSMQHLPRGSVICFGSTIDGEFCVDTVFVVASSEHWTPNEVDSLDVEDAFKVCTGGSIATRDGAAHLELTLYRGATRDERVQGMYSYVPALPADEGGPRFCRPALSMPGLVNAASKQSPRGSKAILPMVEVRDAWEEVMHQILSADLVLGVHIETPRLETS